MLWGRDAQNYRDLIDEKKHLILEQIHPSPKNDNSFIGKRNFSKTNEYLMEHGKQEIDWSDLQ